MDVALPPMASWMDLLLSRSTNLWYLWCVLGVTLFKSHYLFSKVCKVKCSDVKIIMTAIEVLKICITTHSHMHSNTCKPALSLTNTTHTHNTHSHMHGGLHPSVGGYIHPWGLWGATSIYGGLHPAMGGYIHPCGATSINGGLWGATSSHVGLHPSMGGLWGATSIYGGLHPAMGGYIHPWGAASSK